MSLAMNNIKQPASTPAKKLLSQSIKNGSTIVVESINDSSSNSSIIKMKYPSKSSVPCVSNSTHISGSGMPAKLSLTDKYFEIYYAQPLFAMPIESGNASSDMKSQNNSSKLATDLKLHTMENEIIFHVLLQDIESYSIEVDVNQQCMNSGCINNVMIVNKDNIKCSFSLSKWSAKSLKEKLMKLISI